MDLDNVTSLTIGDNTINRIETSYNPNLKEAYYSTSLMTSSASEELVNIKKPKTFFLEEHRENMLSDSVTIQNGTNIYGYTIDNDTITIGEKATDEVFIPKTFITEDSYEDATITTINVNKSIDKLLMSEVFSTVEINNNTEEVLNVYYPNVSNDVIKSNCFYILSNTSTYKSLGINSTTLISTCKGIVLGKDYFDGDIVKNTHYGNFSNVEKVYVYSKIFGYILNRIDKLDLITNALSITQDKIYFYNNVNDIYSIKYDSDDAFEQDIIIRPTSNTINIDTISNGKKYILDCSHLKGTITINRNNSLNNHTLSGLILGNNITKIEKNKFSYCFVLEQAQVNILNESMFLCCFCLKKVNVTGNIETVPNRCFYQCYNLETLTLPDTITTISSYAFYDCKCLHQLNLPDSVTTLGSYSFNYCLLTQINLNNVVNFNINCFQSCNLLKSFVIPAGTTIIRDCMFQYCNSLENLTIPSSVTTINKDAFYKCYNLKNVTCLMTKIEGYYSTDNVIGCNVSNLILNDDASDSVKNTLKTIFGYVESGTQIIYYDSKTISLTDTYDKDVILKPKPDVTFSGILSITLGGNIKTRLIEVEVANGISEIGKDCFSYCYVLKTVILPTSVKIINENAFYNCVNLENISLENIECIYYCAFRYCYELKNIVLSQSLTYIDREVFTSCYLLDNVVIPNSVTTLSNNTFSYCYNLKNITLSTNITSISYSNFTYCFSLENIVIPDSVRKLERRNFEKCYILKNVKISKNITYIGQHQFYQCYLLDNVEILSDSVLLLYDVFRLCYSLKNIICLTAYNDIYASYVSSDADNLIINKNASEKTKKALIDTFNPTNIIEVDKNSEIVYYSGENPTIDYSINYENEVVLLPDPINKPSGVISKIGTGGNINDKLIYVKIDGVSSIICNGSKVTDGVFYNSVNLEKLILGDTLKYIGPNSFYLCTSLKEIIIPDSVTEISDKAFEECHSNSKIVLGENLQKIGTRVFCSNYNVENIKLPNSLTNLNDYDFYYCYSLKNITFNSIIDTIPSYSFYANKSLRNLSIPTTVSKIGSCCFYYCGIENITIPTSVKNIEARAFYDCSYLKSISIPTSISSFPDNTFNNCKCLSELYLPCSLTYLNARCFTNCHSLKDVTCLMTTIKNDYPEESINCSVTNLTFNISADSNIRNNIKTIFNYTEPELQTIYFKSNVIDLSGTFSNNVILRPDTKTIFSGELSIKKGGNINIKLVGIEIPNGITSIAAQTFQNFYCLKDVTLPTSLKEIGSDAFKYCINLKNIELPPKLENSFWYSFRFCVSLENITIPTGLTSLSTYSFASCSSLRSLEIPHNIRYLYSDSNSWNYNLTKLVIPSSVTYMEKNFSGCPNLKEVTCLIVDGEIIYSTDVYARLDKLTLNKNAKPYVKNNFIAMFKPKKVVEIEV